MSQPETESKHWPEVRKQSKEYLRGLRQAAGNSFTNSIQRNDNDPFQMHKRTSCLGQHESHLGPAPCDMTGRRGGEISRETDPTVGMYQESIKQPPLPESVPPQAPRTRVLGYTDCLGRDDWWPILSLGCLLHHFIKTALRFPPGHPRGRPWM